MNSKSFHMRIIVIFSFIFVNAVIFSYCPAYAETIWEKRQKALKGAEEKQETVAETEKTAPSDTPIPLPLDEISVPGQYGSIIETHEGTNGKLILHIQDAHANYEAQKNIADILELLVGTYGVTLILREGNSTDKDFSYLRQEGSPEARRSAAEKLLKEAVITGVDYFNLTYDQPVSFQGIEDKALYDENKNALWEMDRFKYAASEYLNKAILAADSIKAKVYNAELLALDKARKDYEDENTDLLAYYGVLNDVAQKAGIDVSGFTNFANLMEISEIERNMDLEKIRSGDATDEEKRLYDKYKAGLKELNVNGLFKEEPLLEKKIQEAVSENLDQKNLYRISKAMSTMDKMVNIKLVPEEYGYFLENKKDFDPMAWSDFLKKKSDELGLDIDVPGNYYALSDNMAVIEKFYGTAGERDRVFAAKSESRMKKDDVKVAILVTGGFHTPNLTNIFGDAGYSYVVISPKVTVKTDDNLYRASLRND